MNYIHKDMMYRVTCISYRIWRIFFNSFNKCMKKIINWSLRFNFLSLLNFQLGIKLIFPGIQLIIGNYLWQALKERNRILRYYVMTPYNT